MTVMMAAIANGGEFLAPRVVRGIQYGDQLVPTARTVTGELPGDPAHLASIRDMLRHTAHSPTGTARTGVPSGITIGAKTGTAEFGVPYPDAEYDTHGWYIAFAPYDDPEIAVTVYLEHGVGATHAGPVARDIIASYFALKDTPREPAPAEQAPPAGDQVANP
jgi:penicillin-binding protein 2